MGKWKKFLLLWTLLPVMIFLTACWNYREVNQLSIVVGIAIDTGVMEKYQITIEIVKVTGGQEVKMTSEILTMEGKTLFDAVRNLLSVSGKKTYWGHVQITIVSEEIARQGMSDILEWFRQDAETRGDVRLLVSAGKTAKEILKAEPVNADIVSFIVRDCVVNSESLSKTPHMELGYFSSIIESEGIAAIAPVVTLKQQDEKKIPIVSGTAYFYMDKLEGFLDPDETKVLLFLLNEIKGGVLVLDMEGARLAIEITRNKTKMKSRKVNEQFEVEINVKTRAAIDEVQGYIGFDDPKTVKNIKYMTEEMLESQINALVDKAQSEMDTDIFGFGAQIHKEYPKEWKKISGEWGNEFKNVKVKVNVDIQIMNTAMLTRTSQKGI